MIAICELTEYALIPNGCSISMYYALIFSCLFLLISFLFMWYLYRSEVKETKNKGVQSKVRR